jgi:Flp pilus assembly protein TadD
MSAAPLFSRTARALRRLPRWAWPVAVLGVAAVAAVLLWAAKRDPAPREIAAPDDDPRLTFPTPYRNVRPEVRYVGDERCAECHAEAVSFPHHPMARSLAAASAVADPGADAPSAHNPFEKDGILFGAERRGDRIVHTASRRSGDKELYGVAEEVAFAIGSGSHGRSFLVNRGGYLYESPVTWFPQAGRWDISPGLAATTLFDRPIKPVCLFCHGGEVRPVADTFNRYHLPLPQSPAIGCERCHGPAELHLRDRDAGAPAALPDATIVNPARLAPELRDAVCEQCHLQGESRVLRRGREVFDFRPGLPLPLFWSVFVRPPDSADGLKFVGHAEQMRDSACARGSAGRLGCISCHDPHRLPEPAQRVAFYRDRCQRCHEKKPCNRTPPPRDDEHHQAHLDDNCIACHMPRRENADIQHTSVADHRIPRRPGSADRPPAPPRPGDMPLVHFHEGRQGADADEVKRDLGLAMLETSQRQRLPAWGRVQVARMAQSLLDPAVERAPNDLAGREGRGLSLAVQGNPRGALDDFRAVLERAPGREASLVAAADMAAMLEQYGEAEAYWRRALAVNPWTPRSHARLAEVLGQLGRWPDARDECRAALRLNPAGDVRRLLVTCLLRGGDRAAAEAEFQTLLADRPAEEAELRVWWARLAR